MGRKKKNPNNEGGGALSFLKDEARHGILAIVCFAATAFFLLASLGYAGLVGNSAYGQLSHLIGIGFFALPLVLLLLGISFARTGQPNFILSRIIAALIAFVSILGLLGVIFRHSTSQLNGGWLGQIMAKVLFKLFASYSIILLLAVIAIALTIMFDAKLSLRKLSPIHWWRVWRHRGDPDSAETDDLALKVAGGEEDDQNDDEEKDEADDEDGETEGNKKAPETGGGLLGQVVSWGSSSRSSGKFTPPPLSLLEKDRGKPTAGDIKAQANIIKRTLANFGIVVEMDEVSIGPSITRFAFKPAEGVKLSRILALQNDLSLALAAHPLRIEAPIPGKSLVGIEIPNSTKSTVGLASLIGSKDFSTAPHPLYLSLGRSITGASFFSNLTKAPHMLIAGTTGSGKSVVIHTFITSLLYRNPPDLLRFIMIDPKRVELALYNKIPHLLTPVVTDPKKAILVLKWAIKEMERRYGLLESKAVRDIQSYHQNVRGKDEEEKMPYIVVVIDELADIMLAYPRELEAAIVRLAQMSRAVGIHLVLSTQRPSVEVITGLIKANIPSRIALQVASQIDSRTILDMAGAEKLLGAGDMLYLAGDMSKPVRLQSAFVSEGEVKKVVNHIVKDYQEELGDQIVLADNNKSSALTVDWEAEANEDGDDDELYEEARELIIKTRRASASYLQRRLKVGYARAARLLDMLEERNVIGPSDGAKQREIYVDDTESESEAEY
ncbi:MAG: DNA translocase FtsK 4TM domain-containing protein [Patescibacteria group bacterium]|nr:DNA translocase FtsK 4TM domain-containing protein [Patescibacteria group bacterium]